jgi:hypothetical protein
VTALPQLCELITNDGGDFGRSDAAKVLDEPVGQIGDWKETDQCQHEEQGGKEGEKKVVRELCRQAGAVVTLGLARRSPQQCGPGERNLKVRQHSRCTLQTSHRSAYPHCELRLGF